MGDPFKSVRVEVEVHDADAVQTIVRAADYLDARGGVVAGEHARALRDLIVVKGGGDGPPA